jgi:2-hydroxy-6-oxonona-2,4-dienedioate hydrolase
MTRGLAPDPAAHLDPRGVARYRDAEARLWQSLGVAPVERWLTLASSGVRVRVQEVGDGPPAVFVHGGSTSGTSWADLVAALPGIRCVVVDRPGTGLSEPLPAPIRRIDELRELADRFVPDVLDALGLAQADLVATSFGGYFALRAALVRPDRIGRLVLLGWTAGAPVRRLPVMLRLGVTPVVGDLIARIPPNRRAVEAIFRGIGSGAAVADGRISREAIDAFVALLRWTPTLRHDRALGRLFFSVHRGLDERILLSAEDRSRIATPTTFLWGERDAFGDEPIARGFVRPFPDASLRIVPGAGHALWIDDLALVSAGVRDALAAPSTR